MFGKIALEEAVGTSLWAAYGTLPAIEQVSGYAGVPFSSVSIGCPQMKQESC